MSIRITNARVNNLTGVQLDLPLGKFHVLVGPSGSGKSSLALDVLYAEATRLGRATGVQKVYRQSGRQYDVQGLPDIVVGIEQQLGHGEIVESVGSYSGLLHEALKTEVDERELETSRCDVCNGRGYVRGIAPERVLRNPEKSVTGGAFSPAVKQLSGLDRVWKLIAKAARVTTKTPWMRLRADVRDSLLSGHDGFEGILPALRRAADDPNSARIRDLSEELPYYLTRTECAACSALGYHFPRAENIGRLTMAAVADGGDVRVNKQDRRWLTLLGLKGLVLGQPVFRLSSSQARLLRFWRSLRGSNPPSLVIFDEPCAGLLPFETARFVQFFRELRDCGHTVLVVEHYRDVIAAADNVVAFGPGAGRDGGQITYQGPPEAYLAEATEAGELTTRVTDGTKRNAAYRREGKGGMNRRLSASFQPWKGFSEFSFQIPLQRLICICGASGTGKTTFLDAVFAATDKSPFAWQCRVALTARRGHDNVRRPHRITADPIGKHSGSTPATYLKLWDKIRDVYAAQPAAIKMGLSKAAFSFNTKEGQCPACRGVGYTVGDDWRQFACVTCHGKRLKKRSLKVRYDGMTIADTNDLTVREARAHFAEHKQVSAHLDFLNGTALGYLVLGQPSNSLSGGENQRIKVAATLVKRSGDRSVFVLDNPFRGLDATAMHLLLAALRNVVDKGNTVIMAENQPEVARQADWLIFLGTPDTDEGELRLQPVFQGVPEEISDTIWHEEPTKALS